MNHTPLMPENRRHSAAVAEFIPEKYFIFLHHDNIVVKKNKIFFCGLKASGHTFGVASHRALRALCEEAFRPA